MPRRYYVASCHDITLMRDLLFAMLNAIDIIYERNITLINIVATSILPRHGFIITLPSMPFRCILLITLIFFFTLMPF